MSIALIALALLAGCGGSSGDPTDKKATSPGTATARERGTASADSSAGGETISAAAWSTRVEAICLKSQAQAVAAGKKLGRRSAAAGDSKQQLAYKLLQLESKLLGPWVERIDALPEPAGHERAANKFIADMRAIGDLLGQTATAIKQDDAANGKQLVKQLAAKTRSVRGQARSLKIERCNPSPQGVGSTS